MNRERAANIYPSSVTIGDIEEFAIEAYHEPSGPEWGGFGRLAIHIQGNRLGKIRENHCSLFHATDRFRTLLGLSSADRPHRIVTLWENGFASLSDFEIFTAIDRELYSSAPTNNRTRYADFDFLTNTGEMFDGVKTFLVCRPAGAVHILYRLADGSFGSGSCSIRTFRSVAEAYVRWFDETVRTTAPPYFPVDPGAS